MSANRNLNPIQLPSVTDLVYDVLRKEIMAGELAPNQQLNLSQLEAELEISRTPLKIALSRLQNEGLVEIHPRRGTYIKSYSEDDIRECFELRIALEAEALRAAFAPHNAELLGEIIDLFQRMKAYFITEDGWLDQLADYMDLDHRAHVHIARLSGNARLLNAYEHVNVQGYIAMMGTRFRYSDTLETQAEHQQILAALEEQNLPALLHAARAHLEGASQRAILRLVGKEGAR